MRHRPKFRRQIGDPTTTFDGFICTMASGAMALDYATEGDVTLRGGELLARSGLKKAQITDHGTNLGDVARAWKNLKAEKKDDRMTLAIRNNGWSDVETALDRGRAVILQGDYNVLKADFKCQSTPLKDGHAILLLPERQNGAILVADPLCKDFKFVPATQLQKFAEALGSKQHVFHAMTRAVPEKPAAPRGIAKKPVPIKEEAVDPKLDLPVAVCAVTGPTNVFGDPTGAGKPIIAGWMGAPNVGLYSRPKAGGSRSLAAIRIDMLKGPEEDLKIGWVPNTAVSNVRLTTS